VPAALGPQDRDAHGRSRSAMVQTYWHACKRCLRVDQSALASGMVVLKKHIVAGFEWRWDFLCSEEKEHFPFDGSSHRIEG
jgi:hypothetical protein